MSKIPNEILLKKLDAFIRKYYQNQLIKGVILFFTTFLIGFLLVALLEYFGRYTSTIRAILFFSLVFISILTFIRFIIWPATKLLKFGNILSYEGAAEIIGKHFAHVSDKLLNALQLMSHADPSNYLLIAAIEQKTLDLSPLPFTAAVDFKANVKYLKYAGFPLAVLILILLIAPAMVSESANRLLNYSQAFKVPAPFTFRIENDSLVAEQYQDFELSVNLNGQKLPNEVYIIIDAQKYRLEKIDETHFKYQFKNIQKSIPFHLEALGFEDDTRLLEVFAKPVMINYSAFLDFPSYLGKKDERINNPGDISIPAGTIITWNFTGKQTQAIKLFFNKITVSALRKNEVNFGYTKKFFVSDDYSIVLSNEQVLRGDSLHFSILVQPDTYPSISIEQKVDSLTGKYIYLAGAALDDYGLSKLSFNYRFVKSENKEKVARGNQLEWIEIPKDNRIQVNHIFDLYKIGFEPSDELEYYFEVWDNDGVVGPKSTKGEKLSMKAPDRRALQAQTEAESNALENKMEEALKESKELQAELNKLQDKLKSQQALSWEEKKKLEQLLNQQKQLQEKLKTLQKDFKQKNIKEQAFKEEQERIMEKQEQLQKMYEQLMNDEMKQLMKQLENMMKLQNKDQIKKELDKMELGNKDVEKELDRMLEMYKELELDKKMEDAMKSLKNLADEQRNLKQDLEKQPKSAGNEPQQKQEELKQKFEDLQKDLRELEKKNKELESPKNLADTKSLEQEIKDKMEQSSQEMKKGNSKKAGAKMDEAADDLEKMEQQMQEQKEKDEEEKDEIDAQALREILENLIQVSKDQEQIMEDLKQITGYNPKFVALAQKQKILQGNAKIIEDSLLSISKRAPEVKSFINKEVTKMNDFLDKSNQSFSQRNIGEARVQQQYAMTSMNNLAVMLSESLKEMQQKNQQNKQAKGKGKGKPKPKPGSGKPSMSQLKKMQEEMNKQMKEGLNKNGTGKPGGGQLSSEQFARMAAQQMAIRQQMQKMLSQMDALEKEKLGGGKTLGDLQKLMEQTEKDLFNKQLTQETLMRQQDILTRLLEHEKAEKKQEQEQKREAEQGKEKPRPSPQYIEQLNQKRRRETELLQSVPSEMQPYYKQKAKEYLEKAE